MFCPIQFGLRIRDEVCAAAISRAVTRVVLVVVAIELRDLGPEAR